MFCCTLLIITHNRITGTGSSIAFHSRCKHCPTMGQGAWIPVIYKIYCMGAYHLSLTINWLGWLINNGKAFSIISKLTERDGVYHLQFDFLSLLSADDWLETGKFTKITVRKFPPFRSEWKKRSTSEGILQFPNGISGKLPTCSYHLTSNRIFQIFLSNGKHPVPLWLISILMNHTLRNLTINIEENN